VNGGVSWKQAPGTGVLATTATTDGHLGLLTNELDLQVFDAGGLMITQQGPLPNRLQLTSNLLTTNDGFFHYAVGNFVLSYQYTN
jgi:hypothetical protein